MPQGTYFDVAMMVKNSHYFYNTLYINCTLDAF